MVKRGQADGFTLIELLVVIAIIAVLAAILFPVLVRTKSASNRASCQSNLRQLATAIMAYADDNHGFYPGFAPYTVLTERYVRNRAVYRCRSDARNKPPQDGSEGAQRVSYESNSSMFLECTDDLCTPRPLCSSAVVSSTRFVLLVDDSSGDGSTMACWGSPNSDHAFRALNQTGRHDGADNYVLSDGHVRAISNKGPADGAVAYSNITWDPYIKLQQ